MAHVAGIGNFVVYNCYFVTGGNGEGPNHVHVEQLVSHVESHGLPYIMAGDF